MITFIDFLNENSDEPNKTLEEIIAECQPFFKESGGRLVYRGINKPRNPFTVTSGAGEHDAYRMDVRTDRKPLHTDELTHWNIDAIFKKQFGIAARSEGLFVTGSNQVASLYGPTYIVIPRGEFKYLWSPITADMYGVQFKPEDDVEQMVRDMDYKMTDLQDAINSRHEIMIFCKDYYALPTSLDRQIENIIHK